MIAPSSLEERIPKVTIWGDGRALFVGADGKAHEARLSIEMVRGLVDEAAGLLFPLESRINALIGVLVTDGGSSTFSVRVGAATKTVSVYMMGLGSEDHTSEYQVHAAVESLGEFYRKVVAGLPADAPIVELAPILRDIPSIAVLNDDWPRGGLPSHPGVEAYPDPEIYPAVEFRYAGLSQAEVMAWYKTEMFKYGWRLASEGDARQVWVRSPDRSDPIIEMRFSPDRMFRTFVFVEFGLPRYTQGGSPTDPERVAWYREYMGYLGWKHVGLGPYTYESESQLLTIYWRGNDQEGYYPWPEWVSNKNDPSGLPTPAPPNPPPPPPPPPPSSP